MKIMMRYTKIMSEHDLVLVGLVFKKGVPPQKKTNIKKKL